MGKIKECQFTIPVTGLQYTDVRPVITGEDWDDIRETAQNVARSVGNEKLCERLSGAQTGLSGAPVASQEVLGDGVLFNKDDHTYSKNGLPYLSGSVFAHMFEQEFPRDAIAQKVATRDDKEVDDVLAGWDSKGEISLQYGTLIHKCIETYLKHGEMPNNQYLKEIVDDWAYTFADVDASAIASECFIQDDTHQLCGVADALAADSKMNFTLFDWKTGDIHQKIKHTLGKEFPNDRLSLYTLQLNFYRYILEQKGDKVTKMVIGWLNGEHWEKVDVPVIDIKPYLEQVWKPKKLSSN